MKGNKFGGERLESKSDLSKNNLLEHLARYNLVEGDKESVVLDIGCGGGHGSNLLSKKFKKIYGVDISSDAIEYAKKNWQEDNIDFILGSGTNLPFPDNFFDISVAYEVFEHIENWQDFLVELKRVTKLGNIVYISTPNKDVYSPGTKTPINPYHFFEMTVNEFKYSINKFFTITKFFGQRTPIYNDHWIWFIANPVLHFLRPIFGYKFQNSSKLKIINYIKPNLEMSDIVFYEDDNNINKSRFLVAVCKNV